MSCATKSWKIECYDGINKSLKVGDGCPPANRKSATNSLFDDYVFGLLVRLRQGKFCSIYDTAV